jgi:AcrR family transcriptional regulator
MDGHQVEMEERSKRIVETALRLAEKGGFAAVRLRDVAAEAGVALGTVYKRFQSKEDILVAALEILHADFREHLGSTPYKGTTRVARLEEFFQEFTGWLCARPNITRAVLRAMTANEPELASKILRFHTHVFMMIASAILGPEKTTEAEADLTLLSEGEFEITKTLLQLWCAAMVGWCSGLTSQDELNQQLKQSAEWLFLGMEAAQSAE